MFRDWKVQIVHKPGMFEKSVYLFTQNRDTTSFLNNKGELVTLPYASVEEPPYFAQLDDEQLQAFAQTLADKGIKTNKDSIAEGKLAATERHLEDMRTIALAKFTQQTK